MGGSRESTVLKWWAVGQHHIFILYLVMMGYQRLQRIPVLTSVSETTRKPPLAEASNALGKQKIQRRTISLWLWDHDIKFARWQHLATWHVALVWHTCYWIRPNVPHIGILFPVLTSTISSQSTCHSAPVCEILPKSDRPWQKNGAMLILKMADIRHLGF